MALLGMPPGVPIHAGFFHPGCWQVRPPRQDACLAFTLTARSAGHHQTVAAGGGAAERSHHASIEPIDSVAEGVSALRQTGRPGGYRSTEASSAGTRCERCQRRQGHYCRGGRAVTRALAPDLRPERQLSLDDYPPGDGTQGVRRGSPPANGYIKTGICAAHFHRGRHQPRLPTAWSAPAKTSATLDEMAARQAAQDSHLPRLHATGTRRAGDRPDPGEQGQDRPAGRRRRSNSGCSRTSFRPVRTPSRI